MKKKSTTMVKQFGLWTLLMGMVFSSSLFAQIPDPVQFSVVSVPDTVMAGERFEIELHASIEGDWHLYSVLNDPEAGPFPTQFSAKSPNFFLTEKVRESEADIEFDPNFETDLGWHSSFAQFTLPVSVYTSKLGTQILDIEAFYQVCDDRVCLPPTSKSIITTVFVAGVADNPLPEARRSAETQISEANTGSNTANGEGIFSFLWIAILAGFAALLTPCVFPMIPLTVSYFAKQEESKRGVGSAVIFGLAIVATFTLIGMLLAALVGVSGAQNFASNPFVNFFIAAVLIGFALSLLGMYELQLPYQLTNFLNKKSNENSGIAGILFMAMTISAVSFSCTAPFVGAVFAATTGGDWFFPIIGMIGFSAAFASPFVLFALFPNLLNALPKSGSWMNMVKVLLGFIELAAAVKFLSNVDLVMGWAWISRPFAIALWMAIFMIATFYILGFFALKNEEKPSSIGAGRVVLSLPFLLFSLYLIPGLLGSSLGIWDAWLPPKQATDVSVVSTLASMGGTSSGTSADEGWLSSYEQAIEEAKAENRAVFIDFTGYTCTNCRAMESNVFPLASVQERFGQMKLLKLYTDGGTNAQANQQLQFKLTSNVALPTYVILDPSNEQVLAQELGYVSEEKFIGFLDQGLQRFNGVD
jgi:thiol:disulfide interchange protein DsbD